MGSRQVLKAAMQGERLQRLQKLGLIGAGVLWLLLFWWSGWDWWPGVVYAVVPMLVVVLPGVRRLVDESWGLVVGLALFALQLLPEVDGALVAVAWGAAAAVVSACTVRRGQHGWRQWLPWCGVAAGLATAGVGLAVWFSGQADRDRAAEQAAQEQHEDSVSRVLPQRPRAAVFALVEGVADPARAPQACGVFSPTAAAEFAVAHQAADCPGALAVLRTRIQSWSDYVNQLSVPSQPDEMNPPGPGRPFRMDACHLTFTNVVAGGDEQAGPQIGLLTLVQQRGNGWLVTEYRPCPAG